MESNGYLSAVDRVFGETPNTATGTVALPNLAELSRLGPHFSSELAFSPDGKTLVSSAAWNDPLVKVWSVADGSLIKTLTNHTAWVNTVAFSPDGKTLATSGADQTIRLWNPESWQLVATLRGHELEVFSLAFSPDGKHLVSGGRDGVLVWNAATAPKKEPVHIITNVVALNYSKTIDFSSHENSFAALTWDGVRGGVRHWDGDTFQVREDVTALGTNNLSLIFSPNGRLLLTGDQDGKINVWDTQAQRVITNFLAHPRVKFAWYFQFLEQGRVLISSDCNGSIRKWDTASWRELPFPEFQRGDSTDCLRGARATLISPDEHQMLLGLDGEVVVRDLASAELIRTERLDKWGPYAMQFSPDGRLLATLTDNVKLWRWPRLRHFADLKVHTFFVSGVTFTADSQRIVTTSRGREGVKVSDMATLQELVCFSTGMEFYWPLFSPDGNVLSAFMHPGYLYLWRAPSLHEIEAAERAESQPLCEIITSGDRAKALALSTDGSLVVGAASDGRVEAWHVIDGKPQWSRTLSSPAKSVRFSADGRNLLVQCADGVEHVLNSANGRNVRRAEVAKK